MAKTVLTKEQIGRLEVLDIKTSDETVARKQLVKKLKDFDVDGVDNDPIEDLIDILEAFVATEEKDNKAEKPKTEKAPKVKNVFEEIPEEVEEIVEPEEDEEKVVEKLKTKKVKSEKVRAGKQKKVFYDGRIKEHVDIVKKALSFIDLKKYDLVFNQIGVKVCVKSVLSRQLLTLDKIHISGKEIETFKVRVNAFSLIKGNKMTSDVVEEKMTVLPDKIHVEGEGRVWYFGLTIEDLEEIVNSELFVLFNSLMEKFGNKLQKNRERMEAEFETEANEVVENVKKAETAGKVEKVVIKTKKAKK
jgi:hypothetical protein